MSRSIYIGYDPREAVEFAVAKFSMRDHMSEEIPVYGLSLNRLIAEDLHTRPMEYANGRLYDLLSRRDDYDGAISTQHANARFFLPFVAEGDWAMFCDGDILVRDDVADLFDELDDEFAVYCVKHNYAPANDRKMDGQSQTRYGRKNWSSCMVWNLRHPANQRLTLDDLNSLPGRDLHALSWLRDEEIGDLDPRWNWLVGHSDPDIDPALVHFTEGTPLMDGYADQDYAEEWFAARDDWVVNG